MARYKGIIVGGRSKQVSKTGDKETGIKVTANGWDVGCESYIRFDERTGKDVLDVYITSGSHGGKKGMKLIYSSDVCGGLL